MSDPVASKIAAKLYGEDDVTDHRPTVTLQIDVFPEDTFLLDNVDENWEVDPGGDIYTPRQVAVEAWNDIIQWVRDDYLPVLTVLMPDGTSHEIDLGTGHE